MVARPEPTPPSYSSAQVGGVILTLVMVAVLLLGVFAVIDEQRTVAIEQEFQVTFQTANPTFEDNLDNWENIEENATNAYHLTTGGYRKAITIDGTKIVPVSNDNLIVVYQVDNDADFVANMAYDNAQDLRVIDEDTLLQCPHEIENYNPDNGAITMWIQFPTVLGGTDYTYYLDYGDNSYTDQEDPLATWSDNIVAIWHMADNEFGTADDITDITGNGNHLTSVNLENADYIPGKIDGAIVFDGVDEYLQGSAFTDNFSNTGLTVMFWVYLGATAEDIWEFDGANTGWTIDMTGNGFQFTVETPGGDPAIQTASVNTGQWYHVACVYDNDPPEEIIIYLDGTNVVSDTTNVDDAKNDPEKQTINRVADLADAILDEMRVYNRELSADEISTIYNNGENSYAFQTTGPEALVSPEAHIATSDENTNAIFENGYWYTSTYVDPLDEVVSAIVGFRSRVLENTYVDEILRYVYLGHDGENDLVWSSTSTVQTVGFIDYSYDVSSYVDEAATYFIYTRSELKDDGTAGSNLHVDWDNAYLTVVANGKGYTGAVLDDIESGATMISIVLPIMCIALVAVLAISVLVRMFRRHKGPRGTRLP